VDRLVEVPQGSLDDAEVVPRLEQLSVELRRLEQALPCLLVVLPPQFHHTHPLVERGLRLVVRLGQRDDGDGAGGAAGRGSVGAGKEKETGDRKQETGNRQRAMPDPDPPLPVAGCRLPVSCLLFLTCHDAPPRSARARCGARRGAWTASPRL